MDEKERMDPSLFDKIYKDRWEWFYLLFCIGGMEEIMDNIDMDEKA